MVRPWKTTRWQNIWNCGERNPVISVQQMKVLVPDMSKSHNNGCRFVGCWLVGWSMRDKRNKGGKTLKDLVWYNIIIFFQLKKKRLSSHQLLFCLVLCHFILYTLYVFQKVIWSLRTLRQSLPFEIWCKFNHKTMIFLLAHFIDTGGTCYFQASFAAADLCKDSQWAHEILRWELF